MSCSVFCIENDWRQVQVPPPLILLATIWILASVQQLSFLPEVFKNDTRPGGQAPIQSAPTILLRSAKSDKIPWHQQHFHFITRPMKENFVLWTSWQQQQNRASSSGGFLFLRALITFVQTNNSALPDEYANCLMYVLDLSRLIRFPWRAWDRTRIDDWLPFQRRAWRTSSVIFAAVIIIVTSDAKPRFLALRTFFTHWPMLRHQGTLSLVG